MLRTTQAHTIADWRTTTLLLLAIPLLGCDGGAPQQIVDAGIEGTDAALVDADVVQLEGHLPTPRGLSAGCGKPANVGLQSRTIVVDGECGRSFASSRMPTNRTRRWRSCSPFHGSGGTSTGARNTFDFEPAAGGKAIFIYPQALPNAAGVNRWDARAPDGKDFHFVDELIARTAANFCIDRDRIFATGLSLGARFTSNLGCWRGDVLRAIASVAPGGSDVTLHLPTASARSASGRDLAPSMTSCTPSASPGARPLRRSERLRRDTHPDDIDVMRGLQRMSCGGCPAVWCTYELAHQWPSIAPAGVWSFFASFQ